MIHYALTCSGGHGFESWFQSSAAFDKLRSAKMVACPVCGDSEIDKSLMAPSVKTDQPEPATAPRLGQPATQIEQALVAMRRQIEENSEYVGMGFAAEARAIHDGRAPERSIYGETRADEARRLIEDGVPVAPLPFMARRRTN